MKLAKNQIARQFSRAAATYDLAAHLPNEMASNLIEMLPTGVSGHLVDLGCGTGWALHKFAQMNRFELTAVDIAPGMIEIASARTPSATFHCCDLEQTPLNSNMADIVFSNAALQWCNLDRALREIHRIGKPNGKVVFSTFGPKTLTEVRSAWEAANDFERRIHDFESCTSIKTALRRNGFESLALDSIERRLTYDSVDMLLRSIKQLGATNASVDRRTGLLGTQRYQTFRNVFETRLEREGHLALTFECIFAIAKKH